MRHIVIPAFPPLARRARNGIALSLAFWIAFTLHFLLHAIHQIQRGVPVYGRLLTEIFLLAYLAYLLAKTFLLPAAEEEPFTRERPQSHPLTGPPPRRAH